MFGANNYNINTNGKTKLNYRKKFTLKCRPTGPLCDLNCLYCCQTNPEQAIRAGHENSHRYKMNLDCASEYIKKYIESQPTNEIEFYWTGGEPILRGFDFYNKIFALQNKLKEDKTITNVFRSNIYSIDEKWAEFFAKHKVNVTTIIDGPPELHNHYRVNIKGEGTISQISKNIEILNKYDVKLSVISNVNNINVYYPVETYAFIKSLGFKNIDFIPFVKRLSVFSDQSTLVGQDYEGEASLSEASVIPDLFGKFLSRVFDEWIRNDINNLNINYIRNALNSWLGMEQDFCMVSPMCGNVLVTDFNGDVYSCEHYIYPQFKLGNIAEDDLREMVKTERQLKFGYFKKDSLSKKCKNCKFLFACNGDCPKNRFEITSAGDKISYLCEGFRYYYGYIDKYMDILTNTYRQDLPLTEVMKLFKQKNGFHNMTNNFIQLLKKTRRKFLK